MIKNDKFQKQFNPPIGWEELFDQEFPAKGRGMWVNDDPYNSRRNAIKRFIFDLLKERDKEMELFIAQKTLDIMEVHDTYKKEMIERDKEWLSCLPKKQKNVYFTFDECVDEFLENAKSKKLI